MKTTKSYLKYVCYYIIRRMLLHFEARAIYYIIRQTLLHYQVASLLHYQAMLLHYQAFFVTLSDSYYINRRLVFLIMRNDVVCCDLYGHCSCSKIILNGEYLHKAHPFPINTYLLLTCELTVIQANI